VDNSIRFKKLQVLTGALRKANERLEFLFTFQKKKKLGEEGRME
jgi:hypothetical protein